MMDKKGGTNNILYIEMNTVWMLQLDEAKEEFVCQKGN